MARFWGIGIGPFVMGSVSDGEEPGRSIGGRLVTWLIIGALVFPAAPLLGLAIIVMSLLVTAAALDRKDPQS